MNLKQDITDYINTVGIEAASAKFGKAKSTVKVWLKTMSYPIDVVEKYLSESLAENVVSDIPPLVVPEAPLVTLEMRVQAIEDYLVVLNQSVAPQATNNINAPRVAWAPPGPDDGNFKSFVRPDAGVPGKTLSTPAPNAAPAVQQAGVRPGVSPASAWLTPIPRKS